MKKLVVYADPDCPIHMAFETLQGKWKLPVIYVLCENGTLRYGELRKALGITNVMLSNTLKEMEEEGLVIRTQYNEIPPRVDYTLSSLGLLLVPAIEQFEKWGLLLLEQSERRQEESEG